MNTSDIIRKVCSDTGINMAELARRTGQPHSSLSRKLSRDTISLEELRKYMDAMGVKLEIEVTYPKGEEVDLSMDDSIAREKIKVLETRIESMKTNIRFYQKTIKDIRGELYSISGFTTMALKSSNLDSKTHDYLEKIKIANVRSSHILDTVLGEELMKPEDGHNGTDVNAIKGRRILLVDDNDLNREIAGEALRDNGLVVEEAVNGREAVDMISSAKPGYYDFVLMDIEMPGMDGLEASRAIRALPNRIRAGVPIIAITACSFEEDIQKTRDAGMDSHLIKPFSAAKLIEELVRFA